jgi:hypothetical protein
MKRFDQFLAERTMNGDIYMTIGRAFLSLDRALNMAQDKNVAGIGEILNQQLDNLNRAQSEYSQNMRTNPSGGMGSGQEDTTRQLGEIFQKFYGYFQNLRKQLQNPNADFVTMLGQAKNDLTRDYQLAVSLITA